MQVRFCDGSPLQGGLDALRVLEVGGCTGPLPIACALPALQASHLVRPHVITCPCRAWSIVHGAKVRAVWLLTIESIELAR